MRHSFARLFLAAALLAHPASALAQTPGPIFDYTQLAPGVWAAVLHQKGPFAITNSLIVISDDGVLVVDTQQSARAAQEIIAKIRELTDRPVRWVVNTHEHLDHVGGNDAYRQAFGARLAVLAHANAREGVDVTTRALLASEIERRAADLRDQRAQLARLSGNPLVTGEVKAQMEKGVADLQVYLEDLRRLQLHPPDDTFESERVLRLGQRDVHLIHPGPAHTLGDVAVWLPDDGILAAGDLLEDGLSILGEASTPAGWAEALDRLSRLSVKTLLPAHGPVQGRELLDRQRDLFGAVVREARNARGEGLTLDQAWDRIAAAAEAAIELPDGGLPAPRAVFQTWLEICVPRAWQEAARP
jgi:glyoxylase-like metal-dependent hydrolase (beta-lactamase superfamily II)